MLWHEHIRRGVKIAALAGMHYSGALSLLRRIRTRDSAVILMYHRVCPRDVGVPDYSPTGMSVTPDEFHMQMRYLHRHYDVVPLAEIVDLIKSGSRIGSGTCAVTFDDGWRDVYEYAFPVLQSLGVPATMFLTTAYVDGLSWNPEERVRYLLARVHRNRGRAGYATQLEALGLAGILRVARSRMPAFILHAMRNLRAAGPERIAEAQRVLEELAATLDPEEARPFLNWDEVREMAAGGMQFGNHTHTHPVLPDLSDDEVVREVQIARAIVRSRTGLDAADFAYPFGKSEPRVQALVRDCGPASACTTRIGPVCAGADLYALNRVNVCSEVASNEPLFAGRLMCI